MTRRTLIILLLVGVNLISAIAVIQAKQKTRALFQQLQVERVHRDALRTEWAQLELEDSAWASPDRVAQVARNRLGMVEPEYYVVLGDGR